MTRFLAALLRQTVGALRDLAPIIAVIAFFQIVVLQQPFPNLGNVVIGLVCVVAGLSLIIQGLESGLFPLGEALAEGFARKGSPDRTSEFRLLPRFWRHNRRACPYSRCR